MLRCPRCRREYDPKDECETCLYCGVGLVSDDEPTPPSAQDQPADSPERPSVPLTEAILVTLCCCLPFGIVAIVMATRAQCRADAGDYEGARELARNANTWIGWGVGIGLVACILRLAVALIPMSMGGSH